jgi:hypothetical protein
MIAILRERGYQVKEPVLEEKMESSDDLTKCVDWFEGGYLGCGIEEGFASLPIMLTRTREN